MTAMFSTLYIEHEKVYSFFKKRVIQLSGYHLSPPYMKIFIHPPVSYDPQEIHLLLTSNLDGKITGSPLDSLLALHMSLTGNEPRVFQLKTSCVTGRNTGGSVPCIPEQYEAGHTTNSFSNSCVNQLLSLAKRTLFSVFQHT